MTYEQFLERVRNHLLSLYTIDEILENPDLINSSYYIISDEYEIDETNAFDLKDIKDDILSDLHWEVTNEIRGRFKYALSDCSFFILK